MPRHHTIWDASLKRQINVPLTIEEETFRDDEEALALIAKAERDAKDSSLSNASAVLDSGSATLEDVIRFLTLNR